MSISEEHATPAAAAAMPKEVEAALDRLSAAIVRLRAAAERSAGGRGPRGDRDDELALMQDDRARLAAELDAALARGERLRQAQSGVAERLGRAEATIAAALGRLATPADMEDEQPEDAGVPEEDLLPVPLRRGAR